jgi:hypothetical protein
VIPAGTGFLSTNGDEVCRSCFYAEQQRAADGRADASLANMAQTSQGVQSLIDADQDMRRVDGRARATRRCARCGEPTVRVVHVTFHFRGAMPLGRTYRHRCAACSREMVTESPWRSIVEGLAAGSMIVVGGVGAAPSAWGLVWAALGLGGAALLGRTVWRVAQLVRHPRIDRPAHP